MAAERVGRPIGLTRMSCTFATEIIAYLRQGNVPYMAKLYKPTGHGPYPMVVDLHRAWCNDYLSDCDARDRILTTSDFVAAAINFRHASDGYPISLADINFAVRWKIANAKMFNGRADAVGLSGTSSGGHLAMLSAIRPSDPPVCSRSRAGRCRRDGAGRSDTVAVISPISSYQYVQRLRHGGHRPEWIENIPERLELYWKTEEAMSEANPIGILERGEHVKTPQAL